MRMGYTNRLNKEEHQLRQLGCEVIVTRNRQLTEIDSFEQFVKANIHHEIVIIDLGSIGSKFTMNQLYPILTHLKKRRGAFIINEFSKKNLFSNSVYVEILYSVAIHDREAHRVRADEALATARKNGVMNGRPAIDRDIIDRIQYMYDKEGMSIQEVAVACNVSVGTVYKYTRLAIKKGKLKSAPIKNKGRSTN